MRPTSSADDLFTQYIEFAESSCRSLLDRWRASFEAERAVRTESFSGDTEKAFARVINVREAMYAALKGPLTIWRVKGSGRETIPPAANAHLRRPVCLLIASW